MPKHEFRYRLVLEAPFELDPKTVTERIAAAFPDAQVTLDNVRIAAEVTDLPPEVIRSILEPDDDDGPTDT